MSILQPLLAGYSNPLLIVDAADFDGTNDFMTRGAGLTGAADSKTGIFSTWVRVDVDQTCVLLQSALARTSFEWINAPTKDFFIQTRDSANSVNLNMNTTTDVAAPSTWHHVLASWDLAATIAHLYLDDVSDKNYNTAPVNSNVDYTETDWVIGSAAGGSVKFSGCLADLYFAPGQYLDFSLVANRRKFISASLKPVHLGATGSLPTGIAPLIYHHLDDGEAVANFATNRGTGGNFTITGTLDTASTSPSG